MIENILIILFGILVIAVIYNGFIDTDWLK